MQWLDILFDLIRRVWTLFTSHVVPKRAACHPSMNKPRTSLKSFMSPVTDWKELSNNTATTMAMDILNPLARILGNHKIHYGRENSIVFRTDRPVGFENSGDLSYYCSGQLNRFLRISGYFYAYRIPQITFPGIFAECSANRLVQKMLGLPKKLSPWMAG